MLEHTVAGFARFLTARRSPGTATATLLLAALVMAAATVILFGVAQGGDKTRYVHRGAELWSYLLARAPSPPHLGPFDILYLASNLLISAVASLTPRFSNETLIILNIVLYTSFVVYAMRTWLLESAVTPSFILVGATIFLCYGVPGEVTKYLGLHHSSDIIFLSLSGFVLLLLVRGHLLGSAVFKAAAFIFSCLSLLTRPEGLVVFSVVFTSLILSVPLSRSRAFFAAAMVVPALMVIILWPYYVHHALAAGTDVSKGMNYILQNYQNGAVVSGYHPSYVSNAQGYLDFVRITAWRCLYYLIPLRGGYSVAHLLANIGYLAVGGFMVLRGYWHLRSRGQAGGLILKTLALYIVWMTLLHAATQVEDWRYELPLWPAVWLLAGFGMYSNEATADSHATG